MHAPGRRTLLHSAAMAAACLPAAALFGRRADADTALSSPSPFLSQDIAAEVQREAAWAFARAWYGFQDDCDAANWLSFFLDSGQTVLQDAVVNHNFTYAQIAASFPTFLGNAKALLGAGHVTKLFHVAGDVRYGMVAEHVYLQDTFFASNGYTTHSVLDLDGGHVVRSTDYWDSRELGQSDIVGPAATSGVVLPFGAVNPGGTPRLSTATPPPPGQVRLAVGVTGQPSASPDLLDFVRRLHEALSVGSVRDIAPFFAEDATYINPLIHAGPVLYGNFDQTIQVQGRATIARLLGATLDGLPDCRGSTLLHVVGGASGGGFEWRAGGLSARTGIDRKGLVGSTSIDLVEGRIGRMSVKFDTFQLDAGLYDALRAALAAAGIADQ